MKDSSGADEGASITPRIDVISGTLSLLARRLEHSRSTLRDLGFRVSPHGRVSQSIRLLRAGATSVSFPTAAKGIYELADAIGTAFALIQVVDALRHPVPPGLELSLRRSLRGKLGGFGASEHRRALGELRFAASLAAAGVPLGSPRPRPSKTPDFVATVDSFDFLVEVKRPSSENAIPQKIDEAVKQCRKYADRPTAIVLDLTDLLPHPLSVETHDTEVATNRIAFDRLSDVALEYVVEKREEDARDVAGLFLYGEPASWNHPAPDRLPTSILLSAFRVFPDCKMGIVHVSSRRFMRLVQNGLDLLAGKLNVLTRDELLGSPS